MTTTNPSLHRRFGASRQLYFASRREKLRRPLNARATAIGVLAGYRNCGKSVWRVTYKIPEAPEKLYSSLAGEEKCSWAELEQKRHCNYGTG